jgi:predicted MFS family arabinose efflux permease
MYKIIQNSHLNSRKDVAFWIMAGSATAAFLMMFQIYMVAGIIDELSADLKSSGKLMGFIIPAVTLPLGFSALFSGRVIAYFGEQRVARFTTYALAAGAVLVYISQRAELLILSRVLTGIALGNLLPLSFRFTAQYFTPPLRFFPIMIIIFGMAGGMTFGPVLGAMLYPYIGWRYQFLILTLLSSVFCFFVNRYSPHLTDSAIVKVQGISQIEHEAEPKLSPGHVIILLFILLNGIFHSGLFVWTSTLLTHRYSLGNINVGLLLLDFGLPGLILVIILGLYSKGPSVIVMELMGLVILGMCIILIMFNVSAWLTFLAVALLSIGYNITQPLFFGLLGTMRSTHKAHLLTQLGCCSLFIGYGLGPLVFSWLMHSGSLPPVLLLLFLVAGLAPISRVIFQTREGDQ